ncbi:hypothetical protein AL523_17290 [Enterococcus gallinarum]|nr:hypothetical protein AL523_17290 [Enterococcus gallinarum]
MIIYIIQLQLFKQMQQKLFRFLGNNNKKYKRTGVIMTVSKFFFWFGLFWLLCLTLLFSYIIFIDPKGMYPDWIAKIFIYRNLIEGKTIYPHHLMLLASLISFILSFIFKLLKK